MNTQLMLREGIRWGRDAAIARGGKGGVCAAIGRGGRVDGSH